MTAFPDCRTDEDYNFDKLDEKNKEFIKGYDWATEEVVDNFFDNDMGDILLGDSYLGHILNEQVPEDLREEYELAFTFNGRGEEKRTVETYADLIRAKLLNWIEIERDELITSMLDDQWGDEDGEEDDEA